VLITYLPNTTVIISNLHYCTWRQEVCPILPLYSLCNNSNLYHRCYCEYKMLEYKSQCTCKVMYTIPFHHLMFLYIRLHTRQVPPVLLLSAEPSNGCKQTTVPTAPISYHLLDDQYTPNFLCDTHPHLHEHACVRTHIQSKCEHLSNMFKILTLWCLSSHSLLTPNRKCYDKYS
jgi:hypothetical protein